MPYHTSSIATNTQATPDTSKSSWRQSFLGAAALVAKPLTNVVDLPGLCEPSRAVRDITIALKAPKRNDEKAQELEDRIENILAKIRPLISGVEQNRLMQYNSELYATIEKLDGIKGELIKIKSKKYAARLLRQDYIEEFLSRKEQEPYTVIQDLCSDQAPF